MTLPFFSRWVTDSDLILGKPEQIKLGMRLDFLHSVSGSVCVGKLEAIEKDSLNNRLYYLLSF